VAEGTEAVAEDVAVDDCVPVVAFLRRLLDREVGHALDRRLRFVCLLRGSAVMALNCLLLIIEDLMYSMLRLPSSTFFLHAWHWNGLTGGRPKWQLFTFDPVTVPAATDGLT